MNLVNAPHESERRRAMFKCYMDEAGDEGFGPKSSRWFLMAGVIVKTENDLEVSHAIDRIKSRLFKDARKPLHWRDLRHEQKKVVIGEIRNEPFCLCLVAMWKAKLERAQVIRHWQNLYFYTTRFLVERVTWHVDNQGGDVDLTFSNRARLPYDELQEYLERVQAQNGNQIRPVIRNIQSIEAAQRKMLQVADACAGALYNALEPDYYGNYEPSYLLNLADRLYRHRGRLRSYGLKLFPDDICWKHLCGEHPWLEELSKQKNAGSRP